MAVNAGARQEWEVSGRVWHFAGYRFDESSRELRTGVAAVDLESKPLEVLYQLLLHAGEVVTKEELLEAVWPGVTVVEGSLATAVSKLRRALADENQVVVTVPRMGYRLGVPVQCRTVSAPPVPELGFEAGRPVPGRDQWQFARKLGASPSSEVWLAENPKTHETRVFKFAADGIRLKSLKREVTLARLLKDSLGERPGFVRVLEWNFDAPPYYLESEFAGQNLAEWAAAQGGLTGIPLATRLRVLIELAQTVAAAHAAGVIHKDLKPANVLMAPRPDAGFEVKVGDFGCGLLVEPARLSALGITNLGFTQSIASGAGELSGTLMYLPPEVLAGQAPTASADVYALGVMLYQLLAGDFRKPLSPGWEADVADPLLRDDVAEAACGDPARRLASASVLAERLENLERRRTEQNELEQARQRAQVAEQRLAAARVRRPWAIAAAGALVIGLGVSLLQYGRAVRERDRANRQTAVAAAVNRFLSDDLLGRSDPFQSGESDERLVSAVKKSSADIDRQFQAEPEIAARLHLTIARALDNRSDFAGARAEYDRATALFAQAQGAHSEDAIAVRLQRAAMEARSYQKDGVAAARSAVAAAEGQIHTLAHVRDDLPIWLAGARGMLALIDNDVKMAAAQFQTAYVGAVKLPEFNEATRLTLKQKLAFAHIRLGDGAIAERLFRELIEEFGRTSGTDSPNVLRVRLNLAQALMIENKHREAIAEVNRIYPEYVKRLGETHELTMQLLATRAQCEGMLGMFDDCVRDDLAIYDMAVRKQGPASFYAIATLSDAALAQCRAGHTREGEGNARKSWEGAAKAFGPKAGLTGGAAYTLASCDIGLGRVAEATKLLADIDVKQVAQLTGSPDWSANVALAQGEIAYRQGDYAGARTMVESAAPAFSKPDAEPFQQQAVEKLRAELKGK